MKNKKIHKIPEWVICDIIETVIRVAKKVCAYFTIAIIDSDMSCVGIVSVGDISPRHVRHMQRKVRAEFPTRMLVKIYKRFVYNILLKHKYSDQTVLVPFMYKDNFYGFAVAGFGCDPQKIAETRQKLRREIEMSFTEGMKQHEHNFPGSLE